MKFNGVLNKILTTLGIIIAILLVLMKCVTENFFEIIRMEYIWIRYKQ